MYDSQNSTLGFQKILVLNMPSQENWNTALILEDDVDMEVDLKERHKWIMRQVQLEYKQDWDMLYLGHCTWDRREQDVVLSDRGMPGLYEAEYPMCLHAYAVSRECARRLVVVLEERLKTLGQDIDLVLAIGVEFGMSTVLGTTPPYIVQVGRRELASDLTELRDGDTGQRLQNSTLYGLHLRSIDPRTFPAYMA
ncbi:hypothetical protein GGI07_002546 [Coemansia sp. Benny D115]|nr:hypothetical protein GGI07_002546 [Coemansia sp. Benny D115]